MIVRCKCEHKGQDKMYGSGMRVANACKTTDKTRARVRCTVCGKEVEKGFGF